MPENQSPDETPPLRYYAEDIDSSISVGETVKAGQVINPPVSLSMQQEVDRLVEANKAGFAELAGMGAQVDAGGLLNLRIEILAELVLGGGPGMIQFKLRFERKVAEVLEDLRGQVRQAQLAAAQQFSPQQVRQMAKAQGLLDQNGNPVRR